MGGCGLSSLAKVADPFFPSRRYADVIIPRGGQNHVAIAMVADALSKRLREASN